MKKYHIGGARGLTIALLVFSLFAIGMFLAALFGFREYSEGFIPFCIVSVIIFVFFIYLIIHNEIGLRRAKLALNGKKAYGTVKESYMSTGRGAQYHLTISYKNENGEDCEAYMSPPAKLQNKFREGNRIPIRVNGEFAIYDLEEMEKQGTKVLGNCPTCGQALDGTEAFCKSCGNKL